MAFFGRSSSARITPKWQVLSSRIHQLMQLSKYDRALQIFESVVEQGFLPGAFSDLELDMFYQWYGECLIQSARPVEALKILSLGLNPELKGAGRCRETLEEVAMPAVEKYIMTSEGYQDTLQIIKALEEISADRAKQAIRHCLTLAGEAYRNRDYSKASAAYDSVLPLAEQYQCLDFEDLLRAGDSELRCGRLNKAWKLYKSALPFAETFSKSCRLHKKIADLLVIREQEWHAIYHFLLALQAVPGDKGAKTKLRRILSKQGLEQHLESVLRLNAKHSDAKELEISLINLRKKLKAS